MEPKTTINERILLARNDSNLTQKGFADKIGISFRNLQNYETGNTKDIPHGFLEKLASLGFSLEWLFFGTGAMKKSVPGNKKAIGELTLNFNIGQQIYIPKYRGKGVYLIDKEEVKSVDIINNNVIYNNRYEDAVCFETKLAALISIRERIFSELTEEAALWSSRVKRINEEIAILSTDAPN